MPVDRIVTHAASSEGASKASVVDKERKSGHTESDDKPQWMKELIMKRAFSKTFPTASLVSEKNRVAASAGPLRSATQEALAFEGEKACLKGVHLARSDGSGVNAPNHFSRQSSEFAPSRVQPKSYVEAFYHSGGGGSMPTAVHGGRSDTSPVAQPQSSVCGTLRSTVLVVPSNARPVGVDGELDGTNAVCQRRELGRATYTAMGEDKSALCFEKSVEGSDSSSSFHGRPSDISQHDVEYSDQYSIAPQAGTEDDDEEEMFEYGPGIVDKLKSKFLSISLKESERQEREVKRSASLENLLETDKLFQATDSTFRDRTIVAGNRANGYLLQSPSNLKKAKSMETLFFEQKRWNAGRLPARAGRRIAPLRRHPSVPDHLASATINENIVIIENLPPKSETEDNRSVTSLVKRRDYHRQTSNISDDELPKPDIVKTYKRIFESVDKKQPSQTSLKRRPPVVRASAKSCSAHSKPANLQRNAVPSAPQEPRVNGIQTKPSAIKPPIVNGEVMHHQKPVVKEVTSKENMAPVENGDVSTVIDDTDNGSSLGKGMKSISQDSLARIRSHGLTMTFGGGTAAGSKISPLSSQDVNRTTKASSDIPIVTASVKKTALSPTKPLPPFVQKQEPLTSKIPSFTPRQDKKPIANIKPLPKETEPPPQVDPPQATPIVEVKPISASVVSPVENEKQNYIIEPKLDEDDDDSDSDNALAESDVLKPSTLLGNRKPFWQKPPQPTTSIVFDFRGKDVKPNIAVQPTPFGCKPAPIHRKKKRTSSSRLVDGKESPPSGVINGDATDVCGSDNADDDDDDDSDLDPSSLAPPGPCGIVFEGENVKVGVGSLLMTRNKKLRIHFREKLTSTFEYPSESSYLDDLLSPPSPAPLDTRLTNGDDESLSPQEPSSDAAEANATPLFLPSSTLKSTPALGSSGGLASYTPSMLTSTEGFQLGVSRCIRDETPLASQQSESTKTSEEEKEDMLKPANPEDTSSWSSSTDTSDLLF